MNPPRPNIIFLLTDQMRGDCLSVTGHPVVRTPNLDHLANCGTVFTAAYSPCPSCIAARASIFTGLSPSSHGRPGYQDQVPWRYQHMLAQVLSDAGYQTHCVGKTHFYPQRAHLGFQSLESYEALQNFDGRYVNDYHEWLREKTGRNLAEIDHGLDNNSWVSRPSPLPEELHNNTWVVTRGLEFLRRRDRTRPFFLNLSFHRPHPPIDPPQAFYDLYAGRELPPVPVGDWAKRHDVPVTSLSAWHGRLAEDVLRDTRRAYYAQIAHIDAQIGRLILALRRLDLGPTAFVFTSDHGEMLGDHHMFRKTYAYEGSARVPLIICPPDGCQSHRSGAPATLADLYPTMLDLAGVAAPTPVEGQSLLGPCRGESDEWRQYVHGEHANCYDPDEAMQFLTDGREKYIWFTQSGREQLFNLGEDPDELRDLASAGDCAKRLAIWRERMVEQLAQRPQDGLTDGKRLIPGKLLPAVREELLAAPPTES
jgi:arylsulfatase